MYEARAGSIDVDNIATNSNNRMVLRRLQINETSKYVNRYLSEVNTTTKIGMTKKSVNTFQRGL